MIDAPRPTQVAVRPLPRKRTDMELSLPTPPAIAMRILEAVRNENTSFSELARLIASDPALTARILKVANSSFYRLSFPVDSIEKAIAVLGSEALKNIALSFIIVRSFKRKGEDVFDFELFWKRAVTTAVAGKMLAERLGMKSDEVFVLCLLQHIGVVLLFLSRPDEYRRVLVERKKGEPLEEVERRILGTDHQAVGAKALRDWGLPETIYGPLDYLAGGSAPEEYRLRIGILRASALVSSAYHGSRSGEKMVRLRSLMGDGYGWRGEEIDEYIDAVAEKTLEILASFEIKGGGMKPFAQILQEANDELGKLNLSYEQLVTELKLAKEKAERLALDLQEANLKLQELASRDGLTGLFNHRHFQEVLARELDRAGRHGHSLSLFLLDIDHFKVVNDTYGHPAGDAVLQSLSQRAGELLRSTDILARYGGEEFAVILPETGEKGAFVLAERLRRGIEQTQIIAEGHSVCVTVSIGISTWTAKRREVGKAELIAAADSALYRSKKNGRNRSSAEGLVAGERSFAIINYKGDNL